MRVRKHFLLIVFFWISVHCLALAQEARTQYVQAVSKNWKFRKLPDTKPFLPDTVLLKKKGTARTGIVLFFPAQVPGNIYTDLFAARQIPDPDAPFNAAKIAWVDKADWEYRCTFKADAQVLIKNHVNLELAGLDTYAKVYLNDSLVLRSNDMFIGWDVPVKSFLRAGDNTLRIVFESPIKRAAALSEEYAYPFPAADNGSRRNNSMFTRKPAYQYGLDGSPRLLGCGIWKAVNLHAWNDVRIRNIQYRQNSLDAGLAKMTAVFELEGSENETQVNLEINCARAGIYHLRKSVQVLPGIHELSVNFEVSKPQFWWPNGLGKAELYEIRAVLRSQGEHALDSVVQDIGFRTIEMVNKTDSNGRSFYLKVNGVAVFMKGASYMPADLFPGKVNKAKYEQLFQAAVESNFNMLRVNGNGIYERSAFYDIADRRGILIWQDFMFAGRMYPGDSAMIRTIRHEAQSAIKRLRNHPSIALWCGNSGIEKAWRSGNWAGKVPLAVADSLKIAEAYKNIFMNILPAQLRKYDPGRFYLPSSGPWFATAAAAKGNADLHEWDVWQNDAPIESYVAHTGRFMSEYGFRSFPSLRTMQAYKLRIDEQSDTTGGKKSTPGDAHLLRYLETGYRLPQNFSDFWYESQVQQGEAVKTAIEAHRRARNYCMGSLYYQFNESSPGISYSAIDFAGRNKAMYYFAKTAFKPIMISATVEKGRIRVYIVSDQLRELNATLKVQFYTIEGSMILEKRQDILVYPNSSHIYYTVDRNSILKGLDTSTVYLKTILEKDGEVVTDNVLYFSPIKDIPLEEPELSYQVQRAGKYFWLTIKSFRLAKNIFLDTRGTECTFSDNFFDLMPGDSRIILVHPVKDVPDLGRILKIQTLNTMVKP